MSSFAILRPAYARLVRGPGAWLPLSAWSVFALALASLARMHTGARGADGVLLGAFSALALPLVATAIVGSVARGGLGETARPLMAFGVSRPRAAAASVVVAVISSALVLGALGAAVVLVAGSDHPLAADVLTSAWISALGGAAYASFFLLGASFGLKSPSWVFALLVVDWMVGADRRGLALLTPHAHLRNLLGGVPLDDVSQLSSVIALAVITLVAGAIAARFART